MQVQNQLSFGKATYSLNSRTNVSGVTGQLQQSVGKVGEDYDVNLSLKAYSRKKPYWGDCNYKIYSTAVVSKKNKTPFEKFLHFLGMLPKVVVASTCYTCDYERLDERTAGQGFVDVQKAVKKFKKLIDKTK